jgi:hypothetical protein
LVKATSPYAGTVAGQHLLQLLVNLLARQFGVVREILLEVPDCEIHRGVFLAPRITEGRLLAALLFLGDSIGGDLTITRVADGSPATVVICVGRSADRIDVGVPSIVVAGHQWTASVSTSGSTANFESFSRNPIGPYLAACIGAGFAFKSAYGKQIAIDRNFNLWRTEGELGPELDGITFPTAYVLGLGAVGSAFGHLVAASSGLRGNLVAVDPQYMSDTDRNRMLSGTWIDPGESKVGLFTRLFVDSAIGIHTFKGRWPQDYLGDPGREIPPKIRSSERAGRFEWVISAVDRNRDRIGIATQLPLNVMSGSTFGMAAQTAYYSMQGNCECLGCRHRTPVQLGVEDLAEQLNNLTKEERSAWYIDHGAIPQVMASIEEYLDNPSCAGPGAADLARLRLQGRVDWAVGFVSAAAGVILGARFVRAAIVGPDREIEGGSESRYLFWADALRTTKAMRSGDCPICGGKRQG